MEENKLENVQKLLGTPFMGDLPENALKIRRNLLAVSLVSIILFLSGARLDPSSTVLGLKFSGLAENTAPIVLLLINAYLLFHFAWYAVEAFLEWKLRITGMRVSFQTAARLVTSAGDYPDDPRQSTLYGWWTNEARKIGNIEAPLKSLVSSANEFEADLQAIHEANKQLNLGTLLNHVSSMKNDMAMLTRKVEAVDHVINSARIPASLGRFEESFNLSLRIQNARWLLFDIALPSVLGLLALGLLVHGLYAPAAPIV